MVLPPSRAGFGAVLFWSGSGPEIFSLERFRIRLPPEDILYFYLLELLKKCLHEM